MMPLLLVLVLWVLAVMRVTRLINFDTVMNWLHNMVGNTWGPGSWQAEFVSCPWCIGMWVALLTAWVPIFYPDNRGVQVLLLALAASMITGLFSPLSADNMGFDEDEQR